MRRAPTTPTGEERLFGRDEIIVSKTDTRGVITYANDVFLRVCGYAEEDVVGRPHSLIRHPDMPRGVFQLLWRTIESGQEVFAYVVNLAADGAHYWVLAHVTPSFDAAGRITGYHSNRRFPDREAIDAVRPLYARMRAEEARHRNAREAADAGATVLDDAVGAMGLTYDAFVWSLAGASARARAVRPGAGTHAPAGPATPARAPRRVAAVVR